MPGGGTPLPNEGLSIWKDSHDDKRHQARTPSGKSQFLLWSLCRPERLIELARQFILYDEGGAVKKVARYQQYFAIRSTLERVRQRNPDGGRKGGVIWQTQGSGKSLVMVLLGKALALDDPAHRLQVLGHLLVRELDRFAIGLGRRPPARRDDGDAADAARVTLG